MPERLQADDIRDLSRWAVVFTREITLLPGHQLQYVREPTEETARLFRIHNRYVEAHNQ